jgi:hypothetical protein
MITYYPQLAITPETHPAIFNIIEMNWDLKTMQSAAWDITRVHLFVSNDEMLPSTFYFDLGLYPNIDQDTGKPTFLWFTRAIPGFRSGILKYYPTESDPWWQEEPEMASPIKSNLPGGMVRAWNTEMIDPNEFATTSSIFIPLRDCEHLRLEVYEPLVIEPDLALGPRMMISDGPDFRVTWPALTSETANLVTSTNMTMPFTLDIANNYVQWVNTGQTHALFLEIYGGGIDTMLEPFRSDDGWN